MKIAMFTDHFYPELGGIQDSVMLTAASLGARGHTVEVFAPQHPPEDFDRGHVPCCEPDLGKNVAIHRRTSVKYASSTQQSRAALPLPTSLLALSGRRRPDIIHTHSFFGLGVEALVAGRMLGVPVVGTNHTNVRAFGPYMPIPLEAAVAWVVWYYNRCEAITAPSHAVFDDLGRARMRLRPEIVSNPIDTAVFCPQGARDGLKQRFGLGPRVIAYAGRLAPEKNIDILIRALALLSPETQLALAGHGAHEAELRRLAAELGVADRVIFAGTLAKDQLAALFAACELFALMSVSETQSMVSLQAMACGLPVVAADEGALTEFVSPANGRLVNAHDEAGLAAVLGPLLDDADTRARLGHFAQSFAQRHSVEAVTGVWEGLYQRLLPHRDVAWSAT